MSTTNQAAGVEPRPRRLNPRISTASSASSSFPSPLSPSDSFTSSHRSSTFSEKPSTNRPGLSPQDPTTPHSYSEPIVPGSTSSTSRPGQHTRHFSGTSVNSASSSKSNGKSSQETKSVLAKKDRTNDGTYTRCGRHSDEWLFGGWSVTATVKKLFKSDDDEQ